MDIIIKILLILLQPSCWTIYLGNNPLDKVYMKMLQDGVKFTEIDKHTARFGKYLLWTANHPYSSFSLHNRASEMQPSLYVRKKLMKRLLESVVKAEC